MSEPQPSQGDYNTDTVRFRVGELEKKMAGKDAYEKVNHERLEKVEVTVKGIEGLIGDQKTAQAVRDVRDSTRHEATTELIVQQTLVIQEVSDLVQAEKTKDSEDEVTDLRAKLDRLAEAEVARLDKKETSKAEKQKDWRALAFKIIGAVLTLIVITHFKDILAWIGKGL